MVRRLLLALCWRLCWGRGEAQHCFAVGWRGPICPPVHPFTMNIFSSWGQGPCSHGEGSGFELERGVKPLNFSAGGENFSCSKPGAKQVVSELQAIKAWGHLPGWVWDAGLGDAGTYTSRWSHVLCWRCLELLHFQMHVPPGQACYIGCSACAGHLCGAGDQPPVCRRLFPDSWGNRDSSGLGHGIHCARW